MPPPAVIHWVSPLVILPPPPWLSWCSNIPSMMYVTVSKPRCGCHGVPFGSPGAESTSPIWSRWMNGSSSLSGTPAKARRTGKPSPSKPVGAVVRRRTGRKPAAGSSCGRRGRTRTSSTVMAGISSLPDFFEHAGDDRELFGVETIDEAVPDGDQMQGGGGLERGESLVGQHGLLA